MIYVVPTSKANKFLENKDFIVTTDEAEAVSMAVGEYLATGNVATVVMGDNGVLNALDALISLAILYDVPVDLCMFPRDDEPQHKLVTDKLGSLLRLYKIKAKIYGNDKQGEYYTQYPYTNTKGSVTRSV